MSLQAQFEPLTIAEIWHLIQFIPAYDRDTWLKVLMGLKSEFGNDAYSIADAWSQTADNYKANEFRSTWKSIDSSGININTVFYLAKQHGWKPSTDNKKVNPLPEIKIPPPKPVKSTISYALQLNLSANNSDSFVTAHPYSIDKDIQSAGGAGRGTASGRLIGRQSDCIIIPIRNIHTDKVQGVQCINTEGNKQTFGSVSGGALLLGNTLDKSLTWYVCEGWASAYSMVFHHQNGNGVCACSFGKSNQKKVAELIGEVYQPDEIVILLEDDT